MGLLMGQLSTIFGCFILNTTNVENIITTVPRKRYCIIIIIIIIILLLLILFVETVLKLVHITLERFIIGFIFICVR